MKSRIVPIFLFLFLLAASSLFIAYRISLAKKDGSTKQASQSEEKTIKLATVQSKDTDFVGTWLLVYYGGEDIPVKIKDSFGEGISLKLKADHQGILKMNKQERDVTWELEEGRIKISQKDNALEAKVADNVLLFDDFVYGTKLSLVFAREGTASSYIKPYMAKSLIKLLGKWESKTYRTRASHEAGISHDLKISFYDDLSADVIYKGQKYVGVTYNISKDSGLIDVEGYTISISLIDDKKIMVDVIDDKYKSDIYTYVCDKLN